MLFIRTTFLLGLGVLVLPTDEASQARVLSGAKTAMHWTATFCERNPGTCVQGQQAWGVFVKKAEFGAMMAIDLINERDPRGQPAAAPAVASTSAAVQRSQRPQPAKGTSGTLQANDLEPAWRGKPVRSGG